MMYLSNQIWQFWTMVSDRMFIMMRQVNGIIQYAPLYIHTFSIVQPKRFKEAQRFNFHFRSVEDIDSMADRLRWFRYKKGMLQKEVAEYLGIERTTYWDYEGVRGDRNYYPPDKIDKLTELYEVSVNDLLDDYNQFLYYGQGEKIRELRGKKGWTQLELAKRLAVSRSTIKRWEHNEVRIFRETWHKLVNVLDYDR